MENTSVEEKKTVAEKIAQVPVQAGTVVVKGTETVLHDGEQIVIKVGTAAVNVVETGVVAVAEPSKQLGRDVEHIVAPEGPKPTVTPAEITA